jgi:hypothetical protein
VVVLNVLVDERVEVFLAKFQEVVQALDLPKLDC